MSNFIVQHRTRSILEDKIGQLFGYQWTDFVLCFHGDCLHWKMNIYFSHLLGLLLTNIYFWSTRCRKIIQVSFSWYRTKLQTIILTVWFNDCNGRFSEQLNHAQESWPTLLITWHMLTPPWSATLWWWWGLCTNDPDDYLIWRRGANQVQTAW